MFRKFAFLALLATASMVAGKISVIDEQAFDQDAKLGLVLVDFYADWCGPCKRLGPVLEMVADEMGNQIKIYKVNIDQSPNLAQRYEVKGLPTMILFKNGQMKGKLVGFRDKAAVKNFIESEK